MNRAIAGACALLGLGLALWIGLAAFAAASPRDTYWMSLDGPGPTWPSTLYFTSLWLMPVGLALVVMLLVVQFVRTWMAR